MSDQILSLLSFDIAETWRRSFLRREEVARIFVASGWSPHPERAGVEAAYLTLSRLLDLSVRIALTRSPAELADRQKAAAAFGAFLRAISPLFYHAGEPPPPPKEWLHAMGGWCNAVVNEKRSKGAPQNTFLHAMMPKFLALYQVTHNKTPAATAGGATERFLRAIHEIMAKTLADATFDDDDFARKARGNWRVPDQAALLQRIRSFKVAARAEIVVINCYLDGFYESASKLELPPTLH